MTVAGIDARADAALAAFAEEIGGADAGPVTVVGHHTRWSGAVAGRTLHAPAGIHAFAPEEMTVACGAGTGVDELASALAARGQFVALPPGGTVGGALAEGWSRIDRLGVGPVRDTLLQARIVLADGRIAVAGGPTVKNVTGYDLCRLLVGSKGTLAALGDVILRTRPLPAVTRWFAGPVDPAVVAATLFRPRAVLWDGATTWACLAGHPADVAEQAALVPGLVEADAPPRLPPGRRSFAPAEALRAAAGWVAGTFVVEVGVGVVHGGPTDAPSVVGDVHLAELHRRLRVRFDPNHRFAPVRAAELDAAFGGRVDDRNPGAAVEGGPHPRGWQVSQQ